jgi:hypothetical protein
MLIKALSLYDLRIQVTLTFELEFGLELDAKLFEVTVKAS